MKLLKKPKVLLAVKILIPLLVFTLVLYESGSFFKAIDFGLLKAHLFEIGISKFAIILSLGMIAVLPMSFFDLILMKLLGRKMSKKRLLTYSFISNSYSNFLGFGGLTGAALRVYFYKTKEYSRTKVIKAITKISIFYLTGLSLLSWLILFGILDSPLAKTYSWLNIGIIAIGLFLPGLLISLSIKKRNEAESKIQLKYEIQLVLVSLAEWFFALLTMFAIARMLDINISLIALAPIYLTSACAGVISMIPSGLGSFDLIFLLGFDAYGISKEKGLLLLLLYRLSYNFFPWLVSSFMMIGHVWHTANQRWKNIPAYALANISHRFLTIFVFLSGVILLLSAAFPNAIITVHSHFELFSPKLIKLSHLLSVAAGIALLALARGIQYKVKWVYYLSILVLLFGSFFALLRGFDYKEAVFSLIAAFLLFLARGQFYRVNFFPAWEKAVVDISFILFFMSLYFFIGYVNMPASQLQVPQQLEGYTIQDSASLFRSGILGLLIASLTLAAGNWVSRQSHFPFKTSVSQTERIKKHLLTFGGNAFSHLLFLNDKYIFWNKEGNVLFAFQPYADKLVILGDPVGDRNHFSAAMDEFQEKADRAGLALVFYQVSSDMLPLLHGSGFDFFKLGENASVHLDSFSLTNDKMKNFKAVYHKFEKEGFRFRVLFPPYSREIMNEIKEVSEKWLDGRREKGFSYGYYDEEYMQLAPLAVLKDTDDKMIAFTVLMPMYDFGQTLSVDLMRVQPKSPSGTMDYFLICVLLWAKDHKYRFFNLGIDPLSNNGKSKYSTTGEKIASLIYLYGHFFYPFQRLTRFREKYAAERAPKFLAFHRKSSLPAAMLQLSLLISKKGKKPMDREGKSENQQEIYNNK
ncbi:phosphatidylglycerol lysyltransferase [Peribacillus deserti]|uniref:Phosphatidylglycerol lysyltransferase n=1 Tax=Peribacillus deserti TaxID=673318 RepID=A0ABS2QEA2_9BACI|nr:bifunctional lysylphosphatidylglycerol flippase/synthetase MprF [Peribacillus deserti]MBM7691350.1 phosphatidylglycerol lysyltransferase [Peribacillus deserti]